MTWESSVAPFPHPPDDIGGSIPSPCRTVTNEIAVTISETAVYDAF
jgi:hypothetical protein